MGSDTGNRRNHRGNRGRGRRDHRDSRRRQDLRAKGEGD
ncbi:MAG: hypothetical protein [Caudoviricetes sp.]|nr:MAG: hypothetical protein [Caudoviricetes sp.]